MIDSNEASTNPKIATSLQRDFEVVIDPLSCGDYLFIGSEEHKPLLVERKRVFDVVSSISDDRFVSQLKCLKDFEEKGDVCILIEGWMALIRKRKMNISSVTRFIEKIALVWKVPIIPSPDSDWTIEWFQAKAKSMGKPKKRRTYALRPSARIGLEIDDQVRYIIEGYPLIGPKKAIKLLNHFGSIKEIVNASREELMEVVGGKTAGYIVEISGHRVT